MHFLIIEDQALIFDALVMHLTTKFDGARFSYEPDWADDHLARYAPIDCVLFDLDLGDGARYDALRYMRKEAPNLPIIVISGSPDRDAARCAKAHGATAYLRKGSVSDQISGLVELIVRQGLQVFPNELGGDREPNSASIQEIGKGTLTSREEDVLHCLLGEGGSNKAIGQALGIRENTVKSHLRSAFLKIGVSNRAQAIVKLRATQSQARQQSRQRQQA